jgi:hypothetical protein
MSCPALAGLAAAVFAWGANPPSSVTLRPAEPPAAAVVEFRNTLTHSSPYAGFALSLGPLDVSVTIEFGPGGIPDTISLEAPEGWMVAPPVLVVPDNTTGVITIFCSETMGLG